MCLNELKKVFKEKYITVEMDDLDAGFNNGLIAIAKGLLLINYDAETTKKMINDWIEWVGEASKL